MAYLSYYPFHIFFDFPKYIIVYLLALYFPELFKNFISNHVIMHLY